jgi:hypothetical protein
MEWLIGILFLAALGYGLHRWEEASLYRDLKKTGRKKPTDPPPS